MEYPKLKEIVMTGSFTDPQFKELKAICDIRLGNFSAKESALKEMDKNESDTYPLLFHGRLKNILQNECDLSILPYHKLKTISPKVHRDLCRVANELFATAERWNSDKARTRNFAIGIFHLYAELVVNYLKKSRVPVSLKTSLQHVDKFAGLVDDAFPGYVESGCISMVVLGPRRD